MVRQSVLFQKRHSFGGTWVSSSSSSYVHYQQASTREENTRTKCRVETKMLCFGVVPGQQQEPASQANEWGGGLAKHEQQHQLAIYYGWQ
uniref:Uncharacterized protein n=1 Tax=Ditylenchus dipsaci TaxID=166011 RepID=A0A915EGL9_9BILA